MAQGEIILDNAAPRFAPGSTLSGHARWNLDDSPRKIGARIYWSTSGKGTVDAGESASMDFQSRQADEQRFSFNLPAGPYSFEGVLVALTWHVELFADDETIAEVDFRLSPFDEPIVLDQLVEPKSMGIRWNQR